MRNGVLTIEDTGNVLEGGAFGFNVEEVHEAKFEQVPELKVSLVR